MKRLLCLLCLLWTAAPAWAHKASDAFLYVDTEVGAGRLDLALRDLELAVGLDVNGNGEITWGEVLQRNGAVRDYLKARLTIRQGNTLCTLAWQPPALTRHSDGYYAAYRFRNECGIQAPWALGYRLLFDQDPLHRGLLQWAGGEQSGLGVFSPQQGSIEIGTARSWTAVFAEYFRQGVVHLWMGYDHMLFLLALLLPAVVSRRDGRWQAATRLRPVLWDVMGVVTLFTLAHSLTLGLAALQWVQLPSALVEVLIALSISVAAIQVLYPFFGGRRHWLAFGFGLIHGFGFANVLFELTPAVEQRVLALAGFNLGVEAAQLALVLVVVPLLFWLRHDRRYQRWVVPGSAWSIAVLGVLWAWERALLA